MQNKNICKFIPQSDFNTLSVLCFVRESDPEVMKTRKKLNKKHLILVTQGEGTFEFDNTNIPFQAGSLVFGFDNEMFCVKSASPCEYVYIRFEGSRVNELFSRFDISAKNRYFDKFEGLIPLWLESLYSASEQNIALAAESILLYTFSRLSSNLNSNHSNLIGKIMTISEEQLTDSDLSIAKIAENLGYNSKYLSHFFKEKTGITYSEYLRTLRINYAVSLFEHGIDSVKSVALLSGFTDPLYFSTVFKKSIGVSPKDYKRRLP